MRNKSLDAVKAIAACLVVCIHVSFPGQAGQLVKVLARRAWEAVGGMKNEY